MIWADRLAIGVFVLLLLIFGWAVAGENSLHGWDALKMLFIPPLGGSLVCWIVMRTISFVFGGGARRKSRQP